MRVGILSNGVEILSEGWGGGGLRNFRGERGGVEKFLGGGIETFFGGWGVEVFLRGLRNFLGFEKFSRGLRNFRGSLDFFWRG